MAKIDDQDWLLILEGTTCLQTRDIFAFGKNLTPQKVKTPLILRRNSLLSYPIISTTILPIRSQLKKRFPKVSRLSKNHVPYWFVRKGRNRKLLPDLTHWYTKPRVLLVLGFKWHIHIISKNVETVVSLSKLAQQLRHENSDIPGNTSFYPTLMACPPKLF